MCIVNKEYISEIHMKRIFQTVLHDWCNKGYGMCYPVCGMVHIKEPLLLTGKSSPCSSGSGFLLSLSLWRHKTVNKNVLSPSLNKTFPFFPSSFKQNPYLSPYYCYYFSITIYQKHLYVSFRRNVARASLNKTFPSFLPSFL